jgi:predicted HTH transcriptional regulator
VRCFKVEHWRRIHSSAAVTREDGTSTSLGAILFAKCLDAFHALRRKAVRVIHYRGLGRTEALKEHVVSKGYVSGFEGLIEYVNGLLPANEVIEQALRKSMLVFPELAVRELTANALIHQDFFVMGSGPTVEVFDDRIEFTNPGEPLVDTQRFVDTPPKSRNEALASLMRRVRICEERGSGIDKVVSQVEVPVAGTAVRATSRIHTCGPLRSQAVDCDGQDGACQSVLPPCLPTLCDPSTDDQCLRTRAVWNRRAECVDRIATAQ